MTDKGDYWNRKGLVVDDLGRAWLDWCEAERVPLNTIATRKRVLRTLPNAGTATREQVEAWWASRSHLSPATRAADLATLRSFYHWADVWEHRDDDPTRRLTAPKVPKGLPRPMSRADLMRLMGTLPDDLRRAVALGAYGGLRVSEVAALSWADVDLETRRIRVLGKGQKTRLVGAGPLLLDQILPDTGGNVVTAGGQSYSPGALQRRVNRAIHAAGIDGTFHTLRHRFGTVALAATGDLLAVSRAMGHANPATTAIYAATSDEALDRIAEAVCL
jgi:integrase/recombinase XerD